MADGPGRGLPSTEGTSLACTRYGGAVTRLRLTPAQPVLRIRPSQGSPGGGRPLPEAPRQAHERARIAGTEGGPHVAEIPT